jgi:cation transport protein ChaC
MWVFGYGSLIWRPGFSYLQSELCYAKGYKRVWHQGSTDHRGTPGSPGRTVTLDREDNAVVWGRAFRIGKDNVAEVYSYLLEREKQYDFEAKLDLFQTSEDGVEKVVVEQATTWIATSDRSKNPNYLGPLDLDQLSAQIAHSRGPSGPNSEYLFMLCEAMRKYALEDSELFALEEAVQKHLE